MKVYVSKESKKEETKSTAYSFLLVSVFGLLHLFYLPPEYFLSMSLII